MDLEDYIEKIIDFYVEYDGKRDRLLELLVKYASLPRTVPTHSLRVIRAQFIELRTTLPLLIHARKCALCLGDGIPVDVHHIIPLSCGGRNAAENLIPLCRDCHAKVHPWLGPSPGSSGK